MDTINILFGIIMLFIGSIGLFCYLVFEKGKLLDPISISWAGYILYIAIGMTISGFLNLSVTFEDIRMKSALMVLCGSIAYFIGLYTGKGRILQKVIPLPSETLNDVQIWFILLFSLIVGIALIFAFPYVGSGFDIVFAGIISGFVGAISLVCILVMVTYKGKYFTKLVFTIMFLLMSYLIMNYYWSRRPVVAMFFSGIALFYHIKISWRRASIRFTFIMLIFLANILFLLYTGASRVERVRRVHVDRSFKMFSRENYIDFLGGITVNNIICEFIVEQFPESTNYLYGKGIGANFVFFVPRAWWPNKPYPTGGTVSQMWFNDPNPNTSIAPTAPGELYANFGIPGVIIGLFIVGKLIRALNARLTNNPDNLVLYLIWFMIIPDFASEWRGDFGAMTVQPFLRVCIFYFMAWFSGKIVGNKSQYYETELGYYEEDNYIS